MGFVPPCRDAIVDPEDYAVTQSSVRRLVGDYDCGCFANDSFSVLSHHLFSAGIFFCRAFELLLIFILILSITGKLTVLLALWASIKFPEMVESSNRMSRQHRLDRLNQF